MTGSLRASAQPRVVDAVQFEFEGHALVGRAGESLAAALTAAGERELRQTAKGEFRGLFCGMCVCQECLVEVDGLGNQRACMTKLGASRSVRRQPHRAAVADWRAGRRSSGPFHGTASATIPSAFHAPSVVIVIAVSKSGKPLR